MNTNNQQFIKAAIITVIIAGAIGALTVLAGDSAGRNGAEITVKLFLASLSLIFFGITATISMVVAEKPQFKILGNAGMIVSAISFLLVLILIFAGVNNENDLTIVKFAFAFFIASIGLAHICLLQHFNPKNKYANYARITATIFISVFSLVIIVTVIGSGNALQYFGDDKSTMKLGLSSLVIDLAATLLLPLCNRLHVEEPVKFSFSDDQPKPLQEEQEMPPADNNSSNA
jgi:hypothetical protein